MDYKVILGDLFITDLIEVVAYIARKSDEQTGKRIGNELIDKALSLGKNPFVGQPVRERVGARKILRYSYRIYYDVNEAQRTVEVLRVWHGARDPKTLKLS